MYSVQRWSVEISKMAWLTGNSIPTTDFICRLLIIPNDLDLIIAVNGALDELTESENWEKFGTVTPQETADVMAVMWDKYIESRPCMIGSVILYATVTAPIGTLPCDGSTYLRVDYPELYSVLASVYIIDANTFKTPNPPSYTDLNFYVVAK